jgi:hypothetical protein
MIMKTFFLLLLALSATGCGYSKKNGMVAAGTPVIMMVMSNQLVVAINASEIATAGSVPVQVQNPGGTGIYMNQPGPKSNIMAFTVQ